jgi:hypothetical protein
MVLYDSLFSVMMWVAGLVFATHALPSERKEATHCALACLVGCIAYNLAWSPIAPHIIVGIKSTVYFSYISVITAAYCLERSLGKWWDVPLFLLFILDICCHITRAFGEVAFYPYSVAVDAIGYLQIAIFVSIGGDNVRDRFFSFTSNVWNGFSSCKAAPSTESKTR